MYLCVYVCAKPFSAPRAVMLHEELKNINLSNQGELPGQTELKRRAGGDTVL